MRFLVDTNLLARLANGEKDPSFSLAQSSISKLCSHGDVPMLVPQNLYEFWAVATRSIAANGLGMSQQEAQLTLGCFTTSLFQLLQDERAIFSEWKRLISKYDVSGKTTHDARLVAAMLRHEITHVLTFNDAHFARFKEITVLTPQAVLARSDS